MACHRSSRVLKSVGLLNLVSTGGSLRASRAMVCYAAADGSEGTRTEQEVALRLDELERDGLITFRDFADEFRVWQGSDFDLKTAVSTGTTPPQGRARRSRSCSASFPSGRWWPRGTRTQRARFAPSSGAGSVPTRMGLAPLTADDRGDGLVAYVLGTKPRPTRSV